MLPAVLSALGLGLGLGALTAPAGEMFQGAPAAHRLEVWLRDWTGAPVLGAKVTAEVENAGAGDSTGSSIATNVLQAAEIGSGLYLLNTQDESPARIVARKAGLASESARWGPGDGDRLEIVLQIAAAIGGVVRSLDGTPIAGAQLTGTRHSHHWSEDFIDVATSDPAGRFLFSALRPDYSLDDIVEVRAPAHIDRWFHAALGDEEIEIVLVPESVITGRVVDAASGFPVSGVMVYSPTGSFLEIFHDGTTTGEEGTFELRQVSPGAVSLTIRHDGFREREIQGIELPLAGRADVGTIPLEADERITIRGSVFLAPEMAPLPGVEVSVTRAQHSEEDPAESPDSTMTSPDGLFTLRGLSPGVWELKVHSKRRLILASAPLRLGMGPVEPLEILVELAESISGRVLDSDGAPVAGALVFLGYTGEEPAGEHYDAVPHLDAGDCAACWGYRTGSDGSFRLRGLPPFPRYALLVAVNERSFATAQELEVDGTHPIEGLEIRLPAAGAVCGRVVDASGRGVPGASVTAALEGEPHGGIRLWRDEGYEKGSVLAASVETNAAGWFEITRLTPGSYFLGADTPGRVSPASAPVLVEVGKKSSGAKLVCPAGYCLSGVVVGERGHGVPGVELEAWSASGSGCKATSGWDGRFIFDGLEAGTWEIQISGSAFQNPSREVEVPGPEVRLELPAPARLAGRVLLPEGTLIDSGQADLEWMEEDGNLTYSAEIDTTGRFRLEAPPGNYLLGIDLGELGRASRRVTLEAGRTEAIEVPLSPCGRIKGRVSHARSQPYRDS